MMDVRCYADLGGEPWCFGESLKGFDGTTLVWLYVAGIVAIAVLDFVWGRK